MVDDDSARAAMLEQLLSSIGLSGAHHPAAAVIRLVINMYWKVSNQGMYEAMACEVDAMQRSVVSYLDKEPNKSGPVYSAVCEQVDAVYAELSETHASQAALCSLCTGLERVIVVSNDAQKDVAVNDEEAPKTTPSTSLLQSLHESFIDVKKEFGPASNSCALEGSNKDEHEQQRDNAEIPRTQSHFNDTPAAATVVELEDDEEPSNREPVIRDTFTALLTDASTASLTGPPKKKEKRQYPGRACSNCTSTETAQWRRSHDGKIACNACWIHYRTYGTLRPKPTDDNMVYKKRKKRRTKAEILEAKQKEFAANAQLTVAAVAPSPMVQPPLLNFLQKYSGPFVVQRPVSFAFTPNTPLP